jgi:hypothetical protein
MVLKSCYTTTGTVYVHDYMSVSSLCVSLVLFETK